jgi:hypothetical protein
MGGAGLEIGGSGDPRLAGTGPVIGASELTDDNSMAIGMGILISAFAINHARIVEGGEFLCNTMPENLLFLRRFPAVPAGLNSLIYSYPALACWAIFASSLPGLGLPAP